MEDTTVVLKQTLHEIVESLPDEALPEAGRLLNALASLPLPCAFLEAGEDDEPVTEEDIEAIEEARAEKARGELIPWETVEAKLPHDDG